MAVIKRQPQVALELMEELGSIPGCPPGLEYLTQLDKLIVKQTVPTLQLLESVRNANKYSIQNSLGQQAYTAREGMTSYKYSIQNSLGQQAYTAREGMTSYKYSIQNSLGQQAYTAREESEPCIRNFLDGGHSFFMHIMDNKGQEVIWCERAYRCCACCWCGDGNCGWLMRVESPPGTPIGTIRQQTSKWGTHVGIYDTDQQMLFRLWGPCCPCQDVCCTADINFHIYDPKMSGKVARIYKRWDGAMRQAFTNADTFGLEFPMDMDVKSKALLMACAVFLDYMMFEEDPNKI